MNAAPRASMSSTERLERDAELSARHASRPPIATAHGHRTPAELSSPPLLPPSDRGSPLPAPTRKEFELRLGYDLSSVRLHTDAHAATTARALAARAYTLDRDVFFGAGQHRPETPAGRGLLAHELTHVVQQGTGAWPQGAVARQPSDGTTTAPQTFEDLWPLFENEPNPARKRELGRRLVERLGLEPAANTTPRAAELAVWLSEQGMSELAMQAASRTVFVSLGSGQTTTPALHDPADTLVERGEALARDNRHEEAFAFLGNAWQLTQMQLRELTRERQREQRQQAGDATSQASGFGMVRLLAYSHFQTRMARLRRILGVYPSLEGEASLGGDIYLALEYADLFEKLRAHLRDLHGVYGDVMDLETTDVTAPRGGAALRFHGADGRTTDVTGLPGVPVPDEQGPNMQVSTLTEVADDLSAQAALLAGLRRHPEIVKQFAGREIDMNHRADRVRVWRTMFEIYRRDGGPYESPLSQLMLLIRYYLGAFTLHTGFNVRDWGVSYLDQEMPQDLAGRLERDCGVYALTTAYDLFLTAQAFPSDLRLKFELVTTTDHAMLLIHDQNRGTFYVLSNDQISDEHEGGRDEQLTQLAQRAPGPVREQQRYAFTPAMLLELGDTSQSDPTFRREAWQRYLDMTAWGLEPEPAAPGDPRDDVERRPASYETFYARVAKFDEVATEVDQALDGLSQEQRTASVQKAREQLVQRLPTLSNAVRHHMARLVVEYAKDVQGTITSDNPRVVERWKETTPTRNRMFVLGLMQHPGPKPHPMVRTAMALLRLRSLGGILAKEDVAFVDWCRKLNKTFGEQLAEYERSGFPPAF
jgi:hypothetical protein